MTFCHLFKNYPMMVYQNLEPVSSLKKIRCLLIFLMSLILISIIGSIIYIHISNDKNNSNTRRKLDEIEEDITTLYNYTETMSDFIVDNYKPPEIKSGIQTEILLNNLLNVHLDLKKEFDDFKNKSHQVQLDLKKTGEINKNRTETYLRKLALNCLSEIGIHYGNRGTYIHNYFETEFYKNGYEYLNKFKDDISSNLDKFHLEYFEKLLNIDYNNLEVSFGYYNQNPEINYNINPVYKLIINESLNYDLSKVSKFKKFEIYNYKLIGIIIVKPQKFI